MSNTTAATQNFSSVFAPALTYVVGIGEMYVSGSGVGTAKTYALGSCVGLTIYDPVTRVGGMIHLQLPESTIDPKRSLTQPCLFVDTGLPTFFHTAYRAGARKERLIVKAAGGASLHEIDSIDVFQIGKRNFLAVRRLLWKNGILLEAQDVGGSMSRTMVLDLSTGETTVISPDGPQSL